MMLDQNKEVVGQQANYLHPIVFLGIANHVKKDGELPPITPIDIFGLTKQSVHVIYPILLNSFQWIFLINTDFLIKNMDKTIRIEVRNKEGKIILFFSSLLSTVKEENFQDRFKVGVGGNFIKSDIVIPSKPIWIIREFNVDAALEAPGAYEIYFGVDDQAKTLIDEIYFLYQKVVPFTLDQIKAIESDPSKSKTVTLEIGCKKCPTKLKIYTALNRSPEKEKLGYVWQYDVPEKFVCSCKASIQELLHVKESMHGLLGRDEFMVSDKFSYEKRHTYSGIIQIINGFNDLLEKEAREEVFQKFIEEHPILLAKYHAKKIYFKPDVSGKFKTDIVIMTTDSQLILIEIESPNTPLFKKDGHPSAQLTHAYGQVVDWIQEYKRSPLPLLDKLDIKQEDVNSVKGAVIVGKRNKEKPAHVSRHMASSMYPDIEFQTYDGLVDSLAQIARVIGQKQGKV